MVFWYGIFAQAGHSYTVEFEPPADNYLNATKPQFGAISVLVRPTTSERADETRARR
jgi:hypothetical protein